MWLFPGTLVHSDYNDYSTGLVIISICTLLIVTLWAHWRKWLCCWLKLRLGVDCLECSLLLEMGWIPATLCDYYLANQVSCLVCDSCLSPAGISTHLSLRPLGLAVLWGTGFFQMSCCDTGTLCSRYPQIHRTSAAWLFKMGFQLSSELKELIWGDWRCFCFRKFCFCWAVARAIPNSLCLKCHC